jgi:hypothetical protein
MTTPTKILTLVQKERDRQIFVEKYSYQLDDMWDAEQLAYAAACYALPPSIREKHGFIKKLWPWDMVYWKPTPQKRRRELIKAMALLMAEYERLERQLI